MSRHKCALRQPLETSNCWQSSLQINPYQKLLAINIQALHSLLVENVEAWPASPLLRLIHFLILPPQDFEQGSCPQPISLFVLCHQHIFQTLSQERLQESV